MKPHIGITAINSLRSPYARAIERAGGQPVIVNPAVGALPEAPFPDLAGLLLPGGPDVHPSRYGQAIDPTAGVETAVDRDTYEFSLLEQALDRDRPVLAICRGMQVLNVALGGSLRQDLPRHRALSRGDSVYHGLTILSGTRLAEILDPAQVTWTNSRHHQGFGPAELAPDLEAAALVPGEDLIEGVVSRRHSWVFGVQWHPERSDEVPPEFANLFNAFVAACQPAVVSLQRAAVSRHPAAVEKSAEPLR